MSGKGDTPRPLSVDAETYAERYARTFGRKDVEPVVLRDKRIESTINGYDVVDIRRHVRFCAPQDWPKRDTLPTTDPED